MASTGAFPLPRVTFLAGTGDGEAGTTAPELRNSGLWWSWENKDAVLFREPPREGEARPSRGWVRSAPGTWQLTVTVAQSSVYRDLVWTQAVRAPLGVTRFTCWAQHQFSGAKR